MIPISKPSLDSESKRLVIECLEQEQISSQGPMVAQFEEAFARWVGADGGIAVFNGTVALHLALVGLGIGPGDEVIVPDLTFAATINAVLYTGATPVLVDVDRSSWVLDVERCQSKITAATKAILPVHLYGQVADVGAIRSLIQGRGIHVVEDCAEALGAKDVSGQKVGSAGTIGCFSFFANKIISTGEGGMVTSSDSELLKRMRMLRDHGREKGQRYWHVDVGFNYRMTSLQAALGLGQLSHCANFIEERRHIEQEYRNGFKGLPLVWPKPAPATQPVTWLSTCLAEDEKTRDALLDFLRKNNIDARAGFVPLSRMPQYGRFWHADLRDSAFVGNRLISLPTFVGMKRADLEIVMEKVRKFYG